MLTGLSALELGRLRLSVGYGTHKKGRPLSPMRWVYLYRRLVQRGSPWMNVHKPSSLMALATLGVLYTYSNFLRIFSIWSTGDRERGIIGFTSAVELTKLENTEDQRTLAQFILSSDISSKEIRQVAQLRRRSGRTIEESVKEVIGMRPEVVRRYVFVGSIDPDNSAVLGRLTQAERDSIMKSGIKAMSLQQVAGRLGEKFFTLVGQESFDVSMREIGKENIERRLRSHIAEAIENDFYPY